MMGPLPPLAAAGVAAVTHDVSSKELDDIQQTVVLLEKSMGPFHPIVGKAYLFAARVYMSTRSPPLQLRAEAALTRAYEILNHLSTAVNHVSPSLHLACIFFSHSRPTNNKLK